MPWCPRCGTGLSNMEIATEGYREIRHLSLTIRLPITTPGHENESLLVWTTTPVDAVEQRGGGGPSRPVYDLVEGTDGSAGGSAAARSRASCRTPRSSARRTGASWWA